MRCRAISRPIQRGSATIDAKYVVNSAKSPTENVPLLMRCAASSKIKPVPMLAVLLFNESSNSVNSRSRRAARWRAMLSLSK